MAWLEKLLSAFCLFWLFILGRALVCQAAPPHPPGVVIGDFENGSFDGWEVYSDGVSLGHTATGATLGSSALTMNIEQPGFYFTAHRLDASLFPALLNATSLTMDITYDRSLFAGTHELDKSYGYMTLSFATPAGFFQGSPSYDNHAPAAFTPGFWDYDDATTFPNNVDTRTITFDFTQDIDVPIAAFNAHWLSDLDAIRAGDEDFLNMFIGFVTGDGFTSPTLIVDNIRLNAVPEPSAFGLALLCLPTLLRLARKQRDPNAN